MEQTLTDYKSFGGKDEQLGEYLVVRVKKDECVIEYVVFENDIPEAGDPLIIHRVLTNGSPTSVNLKEITDTKTIVRVLYNDN